MFRAPDLAAARHVYGALIGLGGDHLMPGSPLLSPRYPAVLALAGALIWLAPDFGQLFRGLWQYTELRSGVKAPPLQWTERTLRFQPSLKWGLATGLAMAIALLALASQGEASRFVYVQF
jgi:hypothetical protein